MQPETPREDPPPVPPLVRWIAGTALSGGAVALLVVHWTWPRIPFDTAALVLLGLAALPALAVFVKSAKLGGIEVALNQLRRDTKENRRRTEEVAHAQVSSEAVEDRRFQELLLAGASPAAAAATPLPPWLTSELLAHLTEPAEEPARAAPSDGPAADADGAAPPEPSDVLDELVHRYDEVRGTMAGGSGRTVVMTRIVSEMTGAVGAGAQVDVARALRDDSPGRRLSGYAALVVRPDPAQLDQLVDNVVERESGTPFNQYWAIRTLGIVLETAGRRLTGDQAARLRELRGRLGTASDRAYELDRVLRRAGAQS